MCPFLIALFHFKTNLIKQRFFLFSGPSWIAGKFLPSQSEAEEFTCSDKKTFLLSYLVLRVPFDYIRSKPRLKNRVALQCIYDNIKQIASFFYTFREKSTQIKEHPSWEASINDKKFFLICLQSFTFVHIRL